MQDVFQVMQLSPVFLSSSILRKEGVSQTLAAVRTDLSFDLVRAISPKILFINRREQFKGHHS